MTAYEAAVGAVSEALVGFIPEPFGDSIDDRQAEAIAQCALAALATDPDVRAALVGFTHQYEKEGVDAAGRPWKLSQQHAMFACCADAILATLRPQEAPDA